MAGHYIKSNDQTHSLLKTMLGKIQHRYQLYCVAFKTHAMTTHHRGAGHAGKDRDLNSQVEDTENIDGNESTNSSENVLAFGGSEADGHLIDLLPNSQTDLNILTR